MKARIACSVFLTWCVAANAVEFTPLSLPTLTDDIRTWTDGSAYNPLFPSSSQVFAGVPFEFQSDGEGNTAFYGGTLSNPAAEALHIPVGLPGITQVYTLINTAWGQMGALTGSLQFVGSGGLSHTVDLIAGANVRDHYYGAFVNTTTDPATLEAVFGDPSPGHAHLDMQILALPSAFLSETLEEIVFTSVGGNPQGKAFLAGVTVAARSTAVPDGGSTLVLLGIGLVLTAVAGRKPRN